MLEKICELEKFVSKFNEVVFNTGEFVDSHIDARYVECDYDEESIKAILELMSGGKDGLQE